MDKTQIIRTVTGYRVKGRADIDAMPYRRLATARRLAERVARPSEYYLPVMLFLEMPGVFDLRKGVANVA